MIVNLKDALVTGLNLSPGKIREELCDGGGVSGSVPGLYIEARASSPGVGTYYQRFKDSNGKTCHERIGKTSEITLSAARKKAMEFKASITLGAKLRGTAVSTEENAKPSIPTFGDFFEGSFMDYAKTHKRSWKRDEQLYRLRIKEVFGHIRADLITKKMVVEFHQKMASQGDLAPASVDHHAKLMRRVYSLMVDYEIVPHNNLLRFPLLRQVSEIDHSISKAQLSKLVQVLRTEKSRVALIALFLLSTGARLNEALKATWSQIDRQNRVWRIPASNSKSKRVRSVPLNDSAIEVIDQLDTEGKFDYLFTNPRRGNARFSSIHKKWDEIRCKAELPHLHIHSLRRAFASMLVDSGRSLYEVQQVLGHQDPKITMLYARLSSETLAAASNAASIIIQDVITANAASVTAVEAVAA